jgi:hypothetical protein
MGRKNVLQIYKTEYFLSIIGYLLCNGGLASTKKLMYFHQLLYFFPSICNF